MHFCNKKSLHPDPQLKINNKLITVVQQIEQLGLTLNNKINFKVHINYLRQKCIKILNLLKVQSKMDGGQIVKTKLYLYKILIRTKSDYDCIVYGVVQKSCVKKLQPIQNQGQRLCLNAFCTSPM